MGKRAIVLPIFSSILLAGLASPMTAQAQTSADCTPIHIVNVQGTAGSSTTHDPNAITSAISTGLLQAFPGKVSAYETPYPAAAGALGSFAIPTISSSTTFGASRIAGDTTALQHIQQYKKQCKDTAFILTGYSQGAAVAGDVAALIANGALDNVTAEDIHSVYLLADPARSGNSTHTGAPSSVTAWSPLPPGAVYQRNGEFANSPQRDGTVGWTGQRSLSFQGLEGKVISICNDQDLACSAEEESLYRQIADISDKHLEINDAYKQGSAGHAITANNLLGVVNILLGSGFLDTLSSGGSVNEATDKIRASVAASNFNALDQGVITNALDEIDKVFTLLHQEHLFGSTPRDIDIVSHILQRVLPTMSLPIPAEQKPIVDAALGMLTSSAQPIPEDVAARINPYIDYIAKFPVEHTSYFQNYTIDGLSAQDWMTQSAIQGVANYLNNTPISVPMDSGNTGTLEVAEPSRLDDGLRALLGDPERPVTTINDSGNIEESGTSRTSETVDSGNTQPSDSEATDGKIATNPSTSNNETSSGSTNSTTTSRSAATSTTNEVSAATSGVSTPQQGTSAQTATAAAPVANSETFAPKVDTGGNTRTSIFAKVSGIFR